MSEHIIKPIEVELDEQDKVQEDNGLKLYTSNGKHNFKDDDGNFRITSEPLYTAQENPYVHAIGGKNRYLVKISEHGRLFNPYGLYSEGMETKKRVGRPTWKFRSTTKECFNNYITFLRTKNEIFLKHAERELI